MKRRRHFSVIINAACIFLDAGLFFFYFTFYLFGGGGAYAPNAPPCLANCYTLVTY